MIGRSPSLHRLLAAAVLGLALGTRSAIAAPDPSLLRPLSELESQGARVSAAFAKDGGEVAHLHGDRLLNPASVAKLFTAAAALALLGPDFTLPGQVRVVGKAPDATEIAVSTRGDPLLKGRDLDDLAKCVADAGFRSAKRLTVVLDPFDPAHVPPAFDRKATDSAYRAGVAGFQVDRNAIVVSIAPGAPGQPPRVTVKPESDHVRIVNQAVTAPPRKGRGPEPVVTVAPAPDGVLEVRVTGKSPARRTIAVVRRVDDPAAHAGGAFRAALRRAGVRVKGGARVGPMPAKGVAVCKRTSPPLREMLRPVLHDSINPVAETILRLVGTRGSDRPVGFVEGPRVLGDWLVDRVGVPASMFRIANGSGLYDANRVAARAIVRLLVFDRGRSGTDALAGLMPVTGREGTVKHRYKGTSLAGNLRAKTGTLDDAVSLAGTATLPDGAHFDFAVIVNAGDCADKPACGRLDLPAVRRAIDRTVLGVWRHLGGPDDPPPPARKPGGKGGGKARRR
ncbi:MAG TPA: D-alanyl-D-alanine carboxypeptidase/D-alanyl-D-alanine-endopeptidase [Myxococcota bacterium]|nr:D-alanyl-D-alanine carboxypeptidase/D-alanyl-D-alanine-endopeptidase [Myxococcota bacterium]